MYYGKQNTLISISIRLAGFEGDNSKTVCTRDRGIDRIGVLRNKGQHDWNKCGSYTMVLEARESA
jgi:hypothetical protein